MVELTSHTFQILVGVDGSEESYKGLSYASKLGLGIRADIDLLYVRPLDQGMNSGGLQVRVARQNIVESGLELPGVTFLKKGRDLLVDIGHMSKEWEESFTHNDIQGDPLGNHIIKYRSAKGRGIQLTLRAAENSETGILDEQEAENHDLIIIGASAERKGISKILGVASSALKVAVHAPCSVIIARKLEVGNGHLVCLDGSAEALSALKKDAFLANNCQCPISLISVAKDESHLEHAKNAIKAGLELLDNAGIDVTDTFTPIGDPVAEIVERGQHYSLIALAESSQKGVRRFFMGGVAFNVLEHAKNSVMIIR
ncbi:MAG: universal stress protein [Magnetococcales bacterium]|nr:universal stress protein [Magnetococcales bacterium]